MQNEVAQEAATRIAIEMEQEDLDLSTDFEIPSELNRRVHFWVKVFSHYSSNEFILHSSEYPELIFDIASISKNKSTKAFSKAKKLVEKQLKEKAKYYTKVLNELDANPDKINSHIKMKIVNELAHIDDPSKYKKAAKKIRVQKGQSDALRKGLTEFSAYQNHIFAEFEKQKIPTELSYLTFVESTFNLRAVSKVGASGVYQIMPRTGKPFLRINKKFDERRDPIKSAMAASKILKANLRVTDNNWPLAITGYNHGAYGMKKAAKLHNTEDLWKLIKDYKGRTFGFASKNFYAEFLAINYIVENKSQLFHKLREKPVLQVQFIKARRNNRISTILKKYKMSLKEFIQLNPDINKRYRSKRTILPMGYTYKVNKEKYKRWMTSEVFWKNKKDKKLSQVLNDMRIVEN